MFTTWPGHLGGPLSFELRPSMGPKYIHRWSFRCCRRLDHLIGRFYWPSFAYRLSGQSLWGHWENRCWRGNGLLALWRNNLPWRRWDPSGLPGHGCDLAFLLTFVGRWWWRRWWRRRDGRGGGVMGRGVLVCANGARGLFTFVCPVG